MEKQDRAQFTTRLGIIATTVGSAVGLGNIWRFPYEAGVHGGGAFMLIYIIFIFLLGVPVICAEFIMGRETRSNIFGAFRKLSDSRQWAWVGYIGILASLMILSFYSVVAGWTLEYFFQSISGAMNDVSPTDRHVVFDTFASGWRSPVWTIIFLIINACIMLRGVQKGIEKFSNILMPALFILLIIFCINSLTLPGAGKGLEFLFVPDFSKVTPDVLLGALGQAFFSLSLGLGTMLTYGSYFSSKTPLVKSAATTAVLDTLVAILAGVIIFPAVFSFNAEPSAGPKLVFEVLPSIFMQLPFGIVWSTLFFFLLFLASLTSTISMSEIAIAFFTEQLGMTRKKATILNCGIAMVFGTICAFSFGSLSGVKIFGLTFFDLFDYISSNILLPLGGMLISIFVGWVIDRKIVKAQLQGTGALLPWVLNLIVFSLRYIAPIGIAMVFFAGLGII